MRKGRVTRKTNETNIVLSLDLDGTGILNGSVGIGFLDHMLSCFARHSRFDLKIKCKGDTHVDDHHTVEDVGICLGRAFAVALGNIRGIERYGHKIIPMDESVILCVVDISGRAFLNYDVKVCAPKVGTFDTELIEEFLRGFVREAKITLHFKQLSGKNSHHVLEAVFKALGRTLSEAVRINKDFNNEVPSTKGVI